MSTKNKRIRTTKAGVTPNNKQNLEHRVPVAIRRLRTDKYCAAGNKKTLNL